MNNQYGYWGYVNGKRMLFATIEEYVDYIQPDENQEND